MSTEADIDEVDVGALSADMARGRRAAALLNDEMFKEAFEQLQAGYTALWAQSDERDAAGRERLYMAQKVLALVRGHLELALENGTVAARTLDEVRKERSRGFFRR